MGYYNIKQTCCLKYEHTNTATILGHDCPIYHFISILI